MTTYGYICVGNTRGSEIKQRDAILAAYGDITFVSDSLTDTRKGRPHLYELIAEMEPGDTLVATSLDRIAPSADEAIQIYHSFLNMNMSLVFVKEPYFNTDLLLKAGYNDPEMTAERLGIRLRISEISRYFDKLEEDTELRKKRLEEAAKQGSQIGSPKGFRNKDKVSHTANLLLQESVAFGGDKKDAELLEMVNVSKPTFYKIKNSLLERKERK